MYIFDKREDVNKKMSDYIDQLFESSFNLTVSERIEHCGKLIESYFSVMGAIPSHKQLSRLASFIDLNHLMDESKSKNDGDEYPVLTKRQLIRRRRKETPYKEKGTGTDPRN